MSSPRHSSSPIHWNYSQFDDSTYKIHSSTLLFMLVLCSILLLVTLLVVFLFIWGRRDCFSLPPGQPAAAADLPVHSAHQPTPPPQGLDTVAINSLPAVFCKGNGNETECCIICLGTFVEGEKVRVLPHCHHRFHSECVDKWLKTQSSCPLCRDCLQVNSPV